MGNVDIKRRSGYFRDDGFEDWHGSDAGKKEHEYAGERQDYPFDTQSICQRKNGYAED